MGRKPLLSTAFVEMDLLDMREDGIDPVLHRFCPLGAELIRQKDLFGVDSQQLLEQAFF